MMFYTCRGNAEPAIGRNGDIRLQFYESLKKQEISEVKFSLP